jgi:type VI secretion system protein ImpA
VDEDRSAALEIRMNALQSLTDTDGLISDLRDIALTRSTATRLQLRDVERSFAHPRPSDALAPESVTQQLEELRMLQASTLSGFDDALESLRVIEGWCREHLSAYVPDSPRSNGFSSMLLCRLAVARCTTTPARWTTHSPVSRIPPQ